MPNALHYITGVSLVVFFFLLSSHCTINIVLKEACDSINLKWLNYSVWTKSGTWTTVFIWKRFQDKGKEVRIFLQQSSVINIFQSPQYLHINIWKIWLEKQSKDFQTTTTRNLRPSDTSCGNGKRKTDVLSWSYRIEREKLQQHPKLNS